MRYKWVICGLLFLATFINYFDRQILALLKPTLDDKFHWTDTQYGEVTAAFQIAYSIGLLGFGWFVDKFGVRLSYTLSIFAWSLAAMGHALVSSVFGFGVARVALGLGEAGNFPCSIKTVALWFPPSNRAFATSLFNSGANVGALVAPAIVPVVAINYGWQAPFVLAGLVGMAWIGLWIPLFKEPPKTPEEALPIESTEPPVPPIDWTTLLQYRQIWAFTAAKVLTDPIWWFYLTWLPDFFHQTRGLDIKHSSKYLVTIYGIVTVFSIIGCWLAGILIKSRGVTLGRKVAMLSFALLVLPIYFTSSLDVWSAVCIIGLAGAAHQAWSANLYSTVSDCFPKHIVSSVVGFGSMAGSAVSAFFPIGVGAVLDWSKLHGSISAGYGEVFCVCSLAYVVAFFVNHLLSPSFAPIKER